MTSTTVRIDDNLRQVQARIAEAAGRAGRDPSEVLLVGISKTHGIEVIQAAYEAGLRHFGENRVYEGREDPRGADSAARRRGGTWSGTSRAARPGCRAAV